MSDQTQEQYQKAYDEEMAKLNGEAAQATTTPPPDANQNDQQQAAAGTTEPPTADANVATTTPAPQVESAEEVNARLAKVEKALEDTKRWAHQNAAEVKRLKQEAEQRKREETRPVILDDNPGLEDAIRFVNAPAGSTAAATDPQEVWFNTVNGALPDLEKLLGESPDFRALAEQKRNEMGAQWHDPIAATRELGALQARYQSQQAVSSAVEKARKDFAAQQKKSTAMQVPGGGAGTKAPAPADEVTRIQTMSSADFDKMRNKALGF